MLGETPDLGRSASEGAAAVAALPQEEHPTRRLRDIGDAMALSGGCPPAVTATPSVRRSAWMWPGAAALLGLALTALAHRPLPASGRRLLPRSRASESRLPRRCAPPRRQGLSPSRPMAANFVFGAGWESVIRPSCGRSTPSRRGRSPVRKSMVWFLRRSGHPTAGSWPSTTARGGSENRYHRRTSANHL